MEMPQSTLHFMPECHPDQNTPATTSLQQTHLEPSKTEEPIIEASLLLGEKNSSRQPRSLSEFRRQYDRIQESQSK